MGIRGELRGRWERGRVLAADHPLLADIGVALLVQGAMTMPFLVPRAPGLPPASWAAYGLSTLTVLPLVWRRRAPVASELVGASSSSCPFACRIIAAVAVMGFVADATAYAVCGVAGTPVSLSASPIAVS